MKTTAIEHIKIREQTKINKTKTKIDNIKQKKETYKNKKTDDGNNNQDENPDSQRKLFLVDYCKRSIHALNNRLLLSEGKSSLNNMDGMSGCLIGAP